MNTSTGGRLTAFNDAVYYSPNSQVDIHSLPNRTREHGVDRNPFQSDSRFHDFHRPGYWSRPYGWLAFVPLYPNFTSRPFDRLARLPRLVKDPKGWCIPKPVADAWLDLENNLRGSHLPPLQSLRNPRSRTVPAERTRLPQVPPHSRCCERTATRNEAGLDTSVCPTWLDYLAKQGYDQTWLEGFMTSSVYMFTPSPLDGFLPPLDWYINLSIPVWYRWPIQDDTLHPYLTFRPPVDDLQAFLATEQRFRVSEQRSAPVLPTSLAHSLPKKLPPPSTGFSGAPYAPKPPEDPRRKAAQRANQSKNRDRQRWARRLAQPPTHKCRVFVWSPDPNNAGVLRKSKGEPDDLWDFTEKQKWYDPVNEAWHCCVDLAPDEMTNEDHHLMEDLYGSGYSTTLNLAGEAQPADESTYDPPDGEVDETLDLFLPPTQYEEERLGEEFTKTLSTFYGFLPPLPPLLGNASPRASKAERVWALRMIGMHPSISHGAPFFESATFASVTSFLQGLCAKGGKPPADTWDLSAHSRDPIARSGSLPPLRVIPVQPPSIRIHALWDKALETSSDHGFRRRPSVPYGSHAHGKHCSPTYILLAEGRLRAALTRGGIIWRMAVAFLSPWDALSGPSSSASMVVRDQVDGSVYVDDALTPVEMQILCAAYRCVSGPADTEGTIRSWWPLPEVFDISGEKLRPLDVLPGEPLHRKAQRDCRW
ncbi:hypothetical protein BKA70DRAFT_1225391 [Coprinopsis sp. MPI-PUGE-AT-0042]|nr:hypothetical protein BKA70DRAFT_1225391 [Coprinopsis sp. MPI-PUGE-AT-0042]